MAHDLAGLMELMELMEGTDLSFFLFSKGPSGPLICSYW